MHFQAAFENNGLQMDRLQLDPWKPNDPPGAVKMARGGGQTLST